ERELDEQILRESQQQYQNIFEYSSDAIFIHDLQGNIIDVNQKTLSLFGYKKTEILKRNVSELHPAHAQKKSREAFKTIMRDKSVNFEIEFLKKNGDSFPAEVSSTIIKLEGQDVVLGIVRDITERKEMENTLRANEEKYRGIFDESVAAIYLFDVNMHFIASNQAGLDLLGYSREELLKMSIPDVDADPKEVIPAYKQLFAGKRIVNYEHKLKRKDGRIITVLNNSRPILNNEGVVIGLQSTLLDITARKEAEKALKQTIQEMKAVNSVIRQVNRSLTYENVVQSSLKAIFTTIQPDLVLVFLREGDKLFFQGEIYNDPHFRHNKTPVHKVGQCLCGLAVKENKAMYSIDITKDSRCTWVECKEAGFRSFAALPLRSAEETVGVLGLASINKRDFSQQQTTLDTLSHEIAISLQNSIFYRQLKEHATELEKEVAERKLAEDKIQKSLQEKEVLLKEIHHRVKNNLQVISSLLNLQAEGFKDRNIRSLFGQSRDRIRSMALVHESLYKSEDYSQVNFGEYLENLVRQLFRLYQQSDVDLEMKVAPIRLPMDLAIPCGLVVNELVTNALKHAFPSGQAGKITVSFQKEGSRSLVLEVEDDGVGIHEETIPGESGSLGMNLVSILVEDQLRGTLKVRQDGGTHVKILFPWRAGSK
ncbi:MAG: PAS domain S-box protein, partial [Fidelibacterota bacterium]